MDPITRNDVVRLLALCAAEDQRTVGPEDIDLWFGVARAERWTAPAAGRVIVEHASRGADRPRLTAAAITDRIRAVRKQAADSFEMPRIPEDVPDAEYPTWLRAQMAAHTDALVQRWATSGEEPPAQLPSGPTPSPLGQRRVAEITAGAFQTIPNATPTGEPPTTEAMQARRSALAVACPYCSARPDEPCTRPSGGGRARLTHPHPARYPQQEAS